MKQFVASATLLLALTLFSAASFAANPGTICVASNKYHILIEPEKKQIRTSAWGEIVDTFTIAKIDVRSIETLPAIWQTTYTVEDGYSFVVEYRQGAERGTAQARKDGETVAEYYTCYEADDIQR